MSTIRQLVCSAFCSAVLAALVPAQEHGKPGEKPAPAPAAQAKPAAVFVIATVHGKHEVMNKEAFDAKNKQLADEHAKAMQAFEKEKKAAEAAKTKFTGKEPKLETLVATGGEFPTKEAAEAALKKMDEKPKEPAKPPTPHKK